MPSLGEWLRTKRRLYLPWLFAIFLSALLVPVVIQLADANFPAGVEWEATAWFTRLRERAAIPWALAAWSFPMAYTAAVAAIFLGAEILVFALRLDRRDAASSSMGWALRGWRAALAWTVAPPLIVVLLAFLVDELFWIAIMFAAFAPFVIVIILPFFVTRTEYLRAERPALRSRPRWPGAIPVLLWLLAPLALPLLALPAESLPWPGRMLLFLLVLPIAVFLPLVAQLRWLDPAAGTVDTMRLALQPRVFLPVFLQALRWHGWLLMLLLLALPTALALIGIAPQLEPQLAQLDPVHLEPMLRRIIEASRFAAAYWWALTLVAMFVLQPCLAWLGVVSVGRLLLELGEVREAPVTPA